MTRWMYQITRIYKEESMYLQMVIVLFFLLPIAYFAYLSMSAALLHMDIMTLLTSSAVEGVNLIVHISIFYSAYAIHLYMHEEEKEYVTLSLGILLLAQILFLNPFTSCLLFYYLTHFIGWKQMKTTICKKGFSGNWKLLCCAFLVLLLAVITLFLKIKLQML